MITCYLDSQDYSVLTDPKTLSPERIQIRDELLRFAREGLVKFVFSAAIVSETTPISPEATRLAELKADFLSDLCGLNTLVPFDRVLSLEVVALTERCESPLDMFDSHGNWFPEIDAPAKPIDYWQEIRQRVENDLSSMGLSRQQRRATARKAVKNGKPRGIFASQLELQNPSVLAKELIKQYPMKPEYAEMMTRYGLGRATEDEFTEALMGSLRDPRWMMRWFASNHALSSPIAEMVRKPGRELGEIMRTFVGMSAKWASHLKMAGLDDDPIGKGGEISRRWIEMQGNQLLAMVQRAADARKLDLGAVTPKHVDKYCPGISSVVRALYSSVWDTVIGARKEEPSNSQPVDALHAMYAPYVDVFRADRFMSPHIKKQVDRHGTIVVPRLTELVGVLETQIQQAA